MKIKFFDCLLMFTVKQGEILRAHIFNYVLSQVTLPMICLRLVSDNNLF